MSLKFGIVGRGAIGSEHIERMTSRLPGAEVTALSDLNQENAEKIIRDCSLNASFYATDAELIASDVNVIALTNWGPAHEETVLKAIYAGKYVFCEKPLATTAEGCKRVVEAEMKKDKRLVQMSFMRRYDIGYQKLKKHLRSIISANHLCFLVHTLIPVLMKAIPLRWPLPRRSFMKSMYCTGL